MAFPIQISWAKDILTYETLRACSLIGDRNVHTCLHRSGSICQIAVILVEKIWININIWINIKQHLPASVHRNYISGIWVLLLICPMHVSLQTLPQIWTTCILSYEILPAWVHLSSFAFQNVKMFDCLRPLRCGG